MTFTITGTGGPFSLDFGDGAAPETIGWPGNATTTTTVAHRYGVFGQAEISHDYVAVLSSLWKELGRTTITIHQDACGQATSQYLKGIITPKQWHTVCGTNAIYNGN